MQDPHDLDGLSGEHAISPELSAMTAEQVAGTVLARAGQTGPRKRRKGPDGQHIPAEPRRLRRSHEACARCRSKKIKCDSKHPRCTACASAGVACHQEDRYRQQLTPRGHTERLERQVEQLVALLKVRMPEFDLSQIDEICDREGIVVSTEPVPPPAAPPVGWYNGGSRPGEPEGGKYSYSVPAPGYGGPYFMAPPPPGAGYPYPFLPHLHPELQPPGMHPLRHHDEAGSSSPPHDLEVKGQDPRSMDMSSTTSISKAFGVSSQIMQESGGYMGAGDREDLAVGSSALNSGRDKLDSITEPRDTSVWIKIYLRTGVEIYPAHAIWLPRDRKKVTVISDTYFKRLNPHRPVYVQHEFDAVLDRLYKQEGKRDVPIPELMSYDPGFICSFYLILALGTLSELSHKAAALDEQQHYEGTKVGEIPEFLLDKTWPEHAEFFERALVTKADLKVTVSSLQALILLHWYLYIERQGRSLWRLVGHLVRLSTELGLHHDPTTQAGQFSESECQLRIRLWAIVMIHDRGTSILLGRPLAISPSDSNTPHPKQPVSKSGKSQVVYSDHFVTSSGIVELQADIINSLYTPKRQMPEAIIRHARRITKTMEEYRNNLPESYQPFFRGGQWPKSVPGGVVDNNGLTLLKYWIARILLLRVLFSYEELSYEQRLHALTDAIQTAHNIILAHNSLLDYPDVAFFVSPIPIHIASMVILYGVMSKVECLDRQTALEDVWLGLTMLPRLRWRWDRKDMQGQHPLIEKLAEKVFQVTLKNMRFSGHAFLKPEMSWKHWGDSPQIGPPRPPSHSSVATLRSPTSETGQNGIPHAQGSYPNYHSGMANSPAGEGNFPAIPVKWFYPSARAPYWDQDSANPDPSRVNDDTNVTISMVLPQAPLKLNPRDLGGIGCEDDEAYLNEERDETVHPTHMNAWIQHIEQRDLGQLWNAQDPVMQYPQPRHHHSIHR